MNRRQQWKLAVLALALAAGTARAQTGCSSSSSSTVSGPGSAPAVTWEFTTTREGGEARLQIQAGPGATATCESITLRAGGAPVTLTIDGQRVRVQSGRGGRGRHVQASADRVTCGEAITLQGNVQVRFDLKGQCGQIIRADRVTLNLGTGSIEVAGAGSLAPPSSAAVSLDFGVPLVVPLGKQEPQPDFTFWQSFSR